MRHCIEIRLPTSNDVRRFIANIFDCGKVDLTAIKRADIKCVEYYTMTVWILAGNYISFTIAAGLIRLHMPGVKISRV